ncbi:hypothetical protein K2173_005412 [Erythroxylum novogranatense]|uniref:Uncharacterized protein n=1 Tax=Erythroxylum novogranatense TaxID=1862640 RepID=A0AAV8T6G0_9ROSI|nr:hypothetical protein K2173_005412 [Erythroxylum novogranatense]
MEAADVMELFDVCWFEKEILRKRPTSSISVSSEANPDHHVHEKARKLEVTRVLTFITRSLSEQLYSTTSSNSCDSPNSVLCTPDLQTILCGKETTEEKDENSVSKPAQLVHVHGPSETNDTRKKRGKKTMSKSLSELEFEELKGFMDLGFVFSEEDTKSSLVSLIPGLQRLVKRDEEEKSRVRNESAIARPYLSEAWKVLDRRRNEDALVDWRLPAFSNEIDMKATLKWWAHTVASTVR